MGAAGTRYLNRRKEGKAVGALDGYTSLRVQEWSARVGMKVLGAWAGGDTLNNLLDGALNAHVLKGSALKGDVRVSNDDSEG